MMNERPNCVCENMRIALRHAGERDLDRERHLLFDLFGGAARGRV